MASLGLSSSARLDFGLGVGPDLNAFLICDCLRLYYRFTAEKIAAVLSAGRKVGTEKSALFAGAIDVNERWLVISHEASNSGAPRMLLEVLRALRDRKGPAWTCETLLLWDGPLSHKFSEYGPTYFLLHPWSMRSGWFSRLFRGLIDRPWLARRRLAARVKEWKKSGVVLIYNNTATNGRVLAQMRSLSLPVVTHVHELEYSLGRFATPRSLQQTLNLSTRFVAVSPAVESDLVKRGVSAERIRVIPNFLRELPAVLTNQERTSLRLKMGLPENAFIVIGCGHIDWLKGTDLFVEMAARLLLLQTRPLCFVWIGGDSDLHFSRKIRSLARDRVADHSLRFVGAVTDVTPWLAAADLVTVTSRVESFSLVALEAGAVGLPVVGYAAARGPEGLLQSAHGTLVPELQADAMADAVNRFIVSPSLCKRWGAELRNKIGRDYVADVQVERLLSVIQSALSDLSSRT